MRTTLLGLILAIPSLSFANEQQRCVVSFDALRLDVCSGQVSQIHDRLAALADLEAVADSSIRVVKFDGPIHAAQRAAVVAAGAEILGYAPYHAYVVRMPAALDASMRALPGVVWSGPFLPAFKLDINLVRDLEGARIVEQGGIERLTVALHQGVDANALRAPLDAIEGLQRDFQEQGHDHQRLVLRFEHARLAEIASALASREEVSSVSLRWDNELMNSQAGWLHQSGTQPQRPLFDQGIYGCGQVVAAADSGLHAVHCSFSDTTFGQPVTSVCNTGTTCPSIAPDFNHRKIGAHYKWSGTAGTAPADDHGHGTHVMGSLTGNNPAGAVDCQNLTTPGGNTDLDGTAPGAKLISQEMGGSLQYLNTLGGTIYHAASIAFGNGARVHNNSWGSSCRNSIGSCIAGCQVEYRATTRDADAVVWDFPELAVLVAAGNSGGSPGSAGCGPGADVGAPGNAKNVFSIGSNLRGTGGNAMSGFSSRGPTSDRRTKPDMTAQGSSIISASRTACGTVSNSGTSMATPTAAGLAALVRDYLARGFYPHGSANPGAAINNPSSALVKAIMANGAHHITGTGAGGSAPNTSQGWGQIRLVNSLYFDGDARKLWLVDQPAGLQTGGMESHQVIANSGQPLIFTLVWHDFPALVNAMPHWVNQLRLEVEAPDGQVWTQKLTPGGGLTSPNPSQGTSTSDYDDTNNVHQIRFNTPATGVYQVRVRGIQVAQGDSQPYALVATGDISNIGSPDFFLSSAPMTAGICAGEDASFQLGVTGVQDFNDPVTLLLNGLPGPATSGFTVNPVTPGSPPAPSVLTISNTAGLSAGSHPLQLQGNSNGPTHPAASKNIQLTLNVTAATPSSGGLTAPADGATEQPLRPAFSWTAFGGASRYRLQVATDAGFSNLVIDELVNGTSFTPTNNLASNTSFHWRVAGNNDCGDGSFSAARSFTTSNLICSSAAVAIPDNQAAGVNSTMNVSDSGTLAGLRVSLNLTHTYIGDLRLTLSKGGTVVQIVNRPRDGAGNCSGDDMVLILDDAAGPGIQPDCISGSGQAYTAPAYRPANPLSAFNGAALAGDWTLNVTDLANLDTGTLQQWCLLPQLDDPTPGDAIFAHGFE